MTPQERAAQTRRERKAKEWERFRERLAEQQRIRDALNSILTDPNATNAEKLKAAELLQKG